MALFEVISDLNIHMNNDKVKEINESRGKSDFEIPRETKVYYGGNIDDATADNGKSYSDLPTAFKYRNELVSGCTCNGKDPVGLAQVKIEDDPTLKKGDIVAGENGLLVAGRSSDRRGAELNFSPASEKIRAKYGRVPVVARECLTIPKPRGSCRGLA